MSKRRPPWFSYSPARRFARRDGWFAGVATMAIGTASRAADRFPQPEFESGYSAPTGSFPAVPAGSADGIDGILLVIALAIGAVLVLRRRSRRGVVALSLVCLFYFGFWRQGCICPVGSLQNVALALFDSAYAVPAVVIVFFAAPLLVALFWGRVFCACVCPLGAVQDVVALRPIRLPSWLNRALSILPHVYLGFALLLAATQTAFVICRYDPFVGFFRMSGDAVLLAFGGVLLAIGVFVARPYCRFLCPYGVLLGWASQLTRHRVTITPDVCVQCRLCEDACPFDAILEPSAPPAEARSVGVRRLAWLVALVPVAVLGGGWLGSRVGPTLAPLHEDARIAERLYLEDQEIVDTTTLDTRSFRATGVSPDVLAAGVVRQKQRLERGGWWLGAYLALVIGLKLIALSLHRASDDYEPDQATCLGCARCYQFCPREHVRLGIVQGAPDDDT